MDMLEVLSVIALVLGVALSILVLREPDPKERGIIWDIARKYLSIVILTFIAFMLLLYAVKCWENGNLISFNGGLPEGYIPIGLSRDMALVYNIVLSILALVDPIPRKEGIDWDDAQIDFAILVLVVTGHFLLFTVMKYCL